MLMQETTLLRREIPKQLPLLEESEVSKLNMKTKASQTHFVRPSSDEVKSMLLLYNIKARKSSSGGLLLSREGCEALCRGHRPAVGLCGAVEPPGPGASEAPHFYSFTLRRWPFCPYLHFKHSASI